MRKGGRERQGRRGLAYQIIFFYCFFFCAELNRLIATATHLSPTDLQISTDFLKHSLSFVPPSHTNTNTNVNNSSTASSPFPSSTSFTAPRPSEKHVKFPSVRASALIRQRPWTSAPTGANTTSRYDTDTDTDASSLPHRSATPVPPDPLVPAMEYTEVLGRLEINYIHNTFTPDLMGKILVFQVSRK